MAKNTFYFPHDANARNDEKLLAVRMKYGMEGYGIYFTLIEKLLESTEYTLLKDYNTIAFELRVSADKVKSIVEDFGLFQFTDCGKLFYSESLNSRMNSLEEIRDKRREAGRKGAEKRWEAERKESEKQEELKQNMANAINNNSKAIANAMQNNGRVEYSKVDNNSKEILSSESRKKTEDLEVKIKEQTIKHAAAKAATINRRKEFSKLLIPYLEKYGKEMIRRFYNYWTEQNKSGTKMKFELEKTWELPRRLETWSNREPIYSKTTINEEAGKSIGTGLNIVG